MSQRLRAPAPLPEANTTVLVFNSGSSSLKFGLYDVTSTGMRALVMGAAESIGASHGRFTATTGVPGQAPLCETSGLADQQQAVARIARLLTDTQLPAPAAIGHRIVHGGPTLRRHCVIDPGVMTTLEAAVVFAPLHAPPALAVVRFAQTHFAHATHVACFDTAFHAGLPEYARVLPLPKLLRDAGIERYGFHGLSCESIIGQLRAPANAVAGDRVGRHTALPERIVIAHLGNGASVTAVRHGRSVDTSMGLTPSGGVIMGTRSGDLDPGVLIYLQRENTFTVDMLEDLLDRQSGMRGISGTHSDMRSLHQLAPTDSAARLAIDMFCRSVSKQIAAMITTLDGIDLLVFTGGIGEHDDGVRAAICSRLAWIGVEIDPAQNQRADPALHAAHSRCGIRALASQEDEQIAMHASALSAH